ncbi:MAG: BRO family protein [Candidatus Competibacter denitrificans]
MPSDIIPFSFESTATSIRVVEFDGEPWFVAKDITDALEYQRFDTNLIANVPEEWKGTNPIRTLGGLQDLWCLSESGLYFFLARSDKPKALPFQKWLAGDVLPSLRKRGFYGLMPAKERMRHHSALARILKQLVGSRDNLEQHILLRQVADICLLLGITMPQVSLLHKPAPQLTLAEV